MTFTPRRMCLLVFFSSDLGNYRLVSSSACIPHVLKHLQKRKKIRSKWYPIYLISHDKGVTLAWLILVSTPANVGNHKAARSTSPPSRLNQGLAAYPALPWYLLWVGGLESHSHSLDETIVGECNGKKESSFFFRSS